MKKKNTSAVKSETMETADAFLKKTFSLSDTAKKLNDAARSANRSRAPLVHVPSLEQPLASSSFKFLK